jgi:uncharacterized protein involved in cysteine biosynthesis
MPNIQVLLIVSVLLIGGLIWWFGITLTDRLDTLIRQRELQKPE